MSVEVMISIITAGIAFVTAVASFSYNLIQSRKDRIKQIILDNRIKYMYEIREGFSSFIGLACEGAVKSAKDNPEIQKIYFENLFNGYGKIKTYIKPFYDIDGELLKSLDCLYAEILAILNNEKDFTSLESLKEDFADKYLKYDWAYWKYIQKQKTSKYLDSDDAFDEIYFDFVSSIKRK